MPQESAEKAVKITCSGEEAAVERIASAVGSGACVGTICNTVVRAQHFAERIRNVDGAQVILYPAKATIWYKSAPTHHPVPPSPKQYILPSHTPGAYVHGDGAEASQSFAAEDPWDRDP